MTSSFIRGLDPVSVRTLRYAFGLTMSMAIAAGFAWPLSYLTPVLTASFLGAPSRLTFRAGVMFVITIGVACVGGLLLARLVPYPMVFILMTALIIFRVFHAKTGGTSPLLISWLLIAITVIPLVSVQSLGLVERIAVFIVVGAAAAVGVAWFMFGLLPDPGHPDGTAATPPPPAASAEAPTPGERVSSAAISTLVVMPALVLFHCLEMTGSVLVLVFIAILSQQPSFAGNLKAGKAMIVANSMGGVAAIIVYELLVMVPLYEFLVSLILLGGLIFGRNLFAGGPKAPLYGMAFSTVVLIIGSTTTSDAEAGGKVYTRVIQIVVAVLYVVMAFGYMERVRQARRVMT
jgi:hypothetical protein